MRRPLALVALLAAVSAGALALAGCSLKGIVQPPNPPHTIIFIDGPVSPVNHVVHLHWYGTDENGYIIGYEVRLLDPATPADSAWRLTYKTDSILTVPTPNGQIAAVFEARAINDHGIRDPNPARELFNFTNTPPIVKLTGKPNPADHSDTTFASVTVTWNVSDPDGNANAVIYQLWLDGHAATPTTLPGYSYTVPSSDFLVNGVYPNRTRTLYIRGIDDGGMAGPIDSVRWFVRQPVTGTRARLLLVEDVDDVPPANKQSPTGRFRVDTLYANAIARTGLTSDTWSMLRLDQSHPFRSTADLTQTLKLFETVVWYRGEQALYSNTLANYGDGIGPYLDGGGRMFIESMSLVTVLSTYGALSLDFVSRHLNSDGVFQYPYAPDSSAAWGLSSAVATVLPSPLFADSVQNLRSVGGVIAGSGIVYGVNAFRARDVSQALLVARDSTLSQKNPYDFVIGLAVPQANNGLLMVDTYPLVSATISTAGFPQRASLLLGKILAKLLGS